jgi:hypothetical protein
VELVPAPLWAGRAPDAASEWVFREDRARYLEEAAGGGAAEPSVKHILEMEFPSGEATRRAAEELCAHGGEGFVAVVTMASGEKLAVGYSSRFGTLYPLRIASVSSDSGHAPADFPTVKITLESIDGDSSKPITD